MDWIEAERMQTHLEGVEVGAAAGGIFCEVPDTLNLLFGCFFDSFGHVGVSVLTVCS